MRIWSEEGVALGKSWQQPVGFSRGSATPQSVGEAGSVLQVPSTQKQVRGGWDAANRLPRPIHYRPFV